MTRASASVVERAGLILVGSFLLGFHLSQFRQGPLDALLTLAGRTFAGFLATAVIRSGVRIEFLFQSPDLLFRLRQVFLQRLTPAKRTRTGTGTDLDAVLGHTFHVDQALVPQGSHAFRQQRVQKCAMVSPEIGQRVIVHRHLAADPLKRHFSTVGVATAVQFAGTADAPQGRIQPQAHQNARIGGRSFRLRFPCPNNGQQRRQVQTFHIIPDDAHLMVFRDQVLQGAQAQTGLLPIRIPQTRRASCGRRLYGWTQIKQNVLPRCRDRPGCVLHGLMCIHAAVLAPRPTDGYGRNLN